MLELSIHGLCQEGVKAYGLQDQSFPVWANLKWFQGTSSNLGAFLQTTLFFATVHHYRHKIPFTSHSFLMVLWLVQGVFSISVAWKHWKLEDSSPCQYVAKARVRLQLAESSRNSLSWEDDPNIANSAGWFFYVSQKGNQQSPEMHGPSQQFWWPRNPLQVLNGALMKCFPWHTTHWIEKARHCLLCASPMLDLGGSLTFASKMCKVWGIAKEKTHASVLFARICIGCSLKEGCVPG